MINELEAESEVERTRKFSVWKKKSEQAIINLEKDRGREKKMHELKKVSH